MTWPEGEVSDWQEAAPPCDARARGGPAKGREVLHAPPCQHPSLPLAPFTMSSVM